MMTLLACALGFVLGLLTALLAFIVWQAVEYARRPRRVTKEERAGTFLGTKHSSIGY